MQSRADCLCSKLLDLCEISTSVHLGDHLSGTAGVGCKSSQGETEIVGGNVCFPPKIGLEFINPGFKASVL